VAEKRTPEEMVKEQIAARLYSLQGLSEEKKRKAAEEYGLMTTG